MTADRDALIRARAYEIWEEEGRPEGNSEQHWLQAVVEIDAAEASDPAAFTGTAAEPDEPPVKPKAKRAAKPAAEKKPAPRKKAPPAS